MPKPDKHNPRDPFIIKEGASFRHHSKTDWAEASFYPPETNGARTEFLGTYVSKKKLTGVLVVFLLGLLILWGRAAYLQISRGDYYHDLAEGNRIRIRSLTAERGVVYERNKLGVASNIQAELSVPSFANAIRNLGVT